MVTAHTFTARNIANTLWALAKMMHNPGDKFLNTMGAEAAAKVQDFNAQNHANTVWAFATLGMCLCDHSTCVQTSVTVYSSAGIA